MVADLIIQCSSNIPATSSAQSNQFTKKSLQDRRKPQNCCEMCSLEFCTLEELNVHQQQGCCKLIGSIFVECKVAASMQTDGNQPMIKDKNVTSQQKRHKSVDRNKAEQSDGQASKKLYACDLCDRVYKGSSGLYLHRNIHTGARTFKCDPCDKS